MKKSVVVLALILGIAGVAFAQGNAFSFQGRLNDGANAANGRYDLEFKLFDAALGGNQVGPTVQRSNTVFINGVFSVVLDLGAQAFQNPNSIFIEIAIRPFGSPNALTILGPRQQLTVVPFASRSQNSTNADNATNADTAQNSLRLGGVLATDYYTAAQTNTGFIRNSTTTQASSNFNISENGTINGNLSVGGNQSLVGNFVSSGSLQVTGNVRQNLNSNGLVKAMLRVSYDGLIISCYNAIANLSTGNCGFSITFPLGLNNGVYRINFGFSISNRLVSVSAEYPAGAQNKGANYRYFDNNNIEVFTFNTNSDNTGFNGFTLILY